MKDLCKYPNEVINRFKPKLASMSLNQLKMNMLKSLPKGVAKNNISYVISLTAGKVIDRQPYDGHGVLDRTFKLSHSFLQPKYI
jgi:hypothetical protein